ncbi:2695_t:CDS:2, partial [Cetraspora pellucida]
GNGFIFDENNDNFQLIPITTAPSPSKNPNNNPNSDKKMAHGITPKLKITLTEKDVSQKLGNQELLFAENNNNFTLTPLGN